jgi:threonine synthase
LRYVSTRGEAPELGFEDVLLTGLARDGGLYVPAVWPELSGRAIAALQGKSYEDIAYAVMHPFIGGAIPEADLKRMIADAYASFGHPAVAPLKQLDDNQWLLELFHGPTLAFKDVAMQLLARLMDWALAKRRSRATIVGATSGDTGGAAIEAFKSSHHASVFMMHPHGRVSDVQRRQMTTVESPSVHNIAIEGNFDDCQAIVKALFNDLAFRDQVGLAGVNSINWARIMAQTVYYVTAALSLGAPGRAASFCVPTGNFGDVFAGFVAKRMGIPVDRLLIATNVNDILHRALSTGDYSTGTVTPTAAPSMDIQVSSNFERLLFDLGGSDGKALAAQMAGFETSKAMQLTNAQSQGAAALFTSARADAADMSGAIRWAWEHCGELIDPHTACGLYAARASDLPASVPIVTLATAHPAKFRDPVERATGNRPALPARMGDLFDRAERCVELPGEYDAVAAYVAGNATPMV